MLKILGKETAKNQLTRVSHLFTICFILFISIDCLSKTSDQINSENIFSFSLADIREKRLPAVIDKIDLPKNIDLHDYVSYSPYWWPNPHTKDGLPYIRKDGLRNKEQVKKGDAASFQKMVQSVVLLSKEFKHTKDINYAKKAVKFLQVWFLESDTLMNPNVNHGQMIIGKNQGSESGILELRYMISLLAAVPILQNAGALNTEFDQKLKAWFTKYYDWLISSKIGRQAAVKLQNNHGSWYDAQVAAIAIFLGKTQDAKKILEAVKEKRIACQIKPDGSQPLELQRSKSLTYSLFNLQALFVLVALGEQIGVDLWNYQSKDGATLKNAYKFVLDNKHNWPDKYQQIDHVENWRWRVLENRSDILLNILK